MANRNTRRNRSTWTKLARKRMADKEKPDITFIRAYAQARAGELNPK